MSGVFNIHLSVLHGKSVLAGVRWGGGVFNIHLSVLHGK